MFDPVKRVPECVRPVTGTVVRHHRLNLDPSLFEKRTRPLPKPGRGLFALVRKNLGVDEPGMIIDRVMHKREPWPIPPVVAVPDRPTQEPVTAAIGNSPEFLHVDMNKLARPRHLITPRDAPTNRQPTRLIEMIQARHPITSKHPTNR